MWIPLNSCGRQLTIHSKLRDKNEEYIALYEITEVEFDQYSLKLLERNNIPPEKEVEVKLSCTKLIQYGFEVEEKEAVLQK
jgi:hypothetical protein